MLDRTLSHENGRTPLVSTPIHRWRRWTWGKTRGNGRDRPPNCRSN
ncbi:hypothetical protein [Baaleninema sp.]